MYNPPCVAVDDLWLAELIAQLGVQVVQAVCDEPDLSTHGKTSLPFHRVIMQSFSKQARHRESCVLLTDAKHCKSDSIYVNDHYTPEQLMCA